MQNFRCSQNVTDVVCSLLWVMNEINNRCSTNNNNNNNNKFYFTTILSTNAFMLTVVSKWIITRMK